MDGMVEITPSKERGKVRYFIWAAVSLFLILFTNSWEAWGGGDGSVVRSNFREVVWALNLVYIVALFGNVLLLVSNPWWMRLLVELALATAGLLAGMQLYRVFPFELGPRAVVVAHFVLLLVLLSLGVSIFVSLVRLASGSRWPRRHAHY